MQKFEESYVKIAYCLCMYKTVIRIKLNAHRVCNLTSSVQRGKSTANTSRSN